MVYMCDRVALSDGCADYGGLGYLRVDGGDYVTVSEV